MSNPRKIGVHFPRRIKEIWQNATEEQITSGKEEVQKSVVVNIHLDEELGKMALEIIERVLSGEFEGLELWEQSTLGQYERDLGERKLIYTPDTHILTIKDSQEVSSIPKNLRESKGELEHRVYRVISCIMGEVYRQTFLELIKINGGRVLLDEMTGSIITLEMEIF